MIPAIPKFKEVFEKTASIKAIRDRTTKPPFNFKWLYGIPDLEELIASEPYYRLPVNRMLAKRNSLLDGTPFEIFTSDSNKAPNHIMFYAYWPIFMEYIQKDAHPLTDVEFKSLEKFFNDFGAPIYHRFVDFKIPIQKYSEFVNTFKRISKGFELIEKVEQLKVKKQYEGIVDLMEQNGMRRKYILDIKIYFNLPIDENEDTLASL